ncbi:hypothetical protein AKO1_013619 [Acrasis kona]|uniref:AB hydrolase-1 domain-containing protein n=1 Tax=Acrasis kona TaxID=1008807 RepID=A0AAW2YWF3_9EUKA
MDQKTFVQLGQGRTRYIYEGDTSNSESPLIVCIHGIGSASYSFQMLSEALIKSGSVRILRLDLYGRGHSDAVSDPHTGELFVDQVQELLEKLNLQNDKITLIGHSMGGCISALFTHKYPDKVERLILLTPAGLPWNLPTGSSLLKIPYLGRWVFGMLSSFVAPEKTVAENFFDLEYSKDNIATLLKNRGETEQSKWTDALVNSVNNFPLTTSVEQITEISRQERPTLIIWAEYDITTPSDICFPQWVKLFKSNPKAEFVVVKDTRHNLHCEEVELSNQLITSWVHGRDFKSMDLHKLRNTKSANVTLTARDEIIKKFWLDNKVQYSAYMI